MVAYPGHPLDTIIGRSRCEPELLVQKLLGSDAFLLLIRQAVNEAEQRLVGSAGKHFGIEVRRAISRELQCGIGDDDSTPTVDESNAEQDYPRLTPLG
jgi:hypothetical protein